MRRFNLMVMVLLTALLMSSSPAWSLDRFINLNDGTMLDTVSSLRWLQNANCYDKQNIGNANSLSANLTTGLCGLADSSAAGDWHLPTIDELSTLIAAPDSYRTATLITAGFTNVANTSSYRSSTIQSSGYTTYFWDMQMYDGVAINNPDSYQRYVWPVRPGQNWRLNSLAIVGTAGFGAQAVGSVSSAHQFILKNFGSDPLPVTAIALGGTNLDQFTLTTGGSLPCLTLSPTLAAGASCTVLVAATPTSVGSKNATLTVTTASGTSDVPLTGIAYMPVVYAVSPASGPTTGVTPVVISGANLTGATGVRFGNNGAGYIISSDSQIIAYSPAASAGTVDITIITPGAVSAVNSADQFTYTRVNQTVAFGPAPLIGVGGKGVVSTTVNSGLAVALSSLTPSVCTISGTTVTGVAAGMCSIAANQSGDGTYNAAVTQTLSFTINAAQEPIGVTAAATVITPTSATLNGIVNANYSSADVSFEYGTTTAYGSSATASQSPVAGYSDTTVSAVVTLNPNTLYHFRIKVVNAVTGTFYGNDLTFTTPLPRFVNLKDGTMLDSVNSLRWLQNVDCNPGANWADAQAWSNNLASGTCGLSDGSAVAAWHLPTKDELYSLVDYPDLYRGDIRYSNFGNSFQDAGFIYSVNATQWTSTTDPSDSNSALSVYTYKTANVYSSPKSISKGVWPVRGGQYWTVGSLVVIGTTDFGAQALDIASSVHQFTLHNIGSTPQSVTSIAPGGTNADQFILTTGGTSPCQSLSPMLAGGTSCTVIVTAKPTSVGSKSAILEVSTAGGSVNVPLSTSTSASVTYNGNGNSSGTVPNDSTVYSYGTPATVLGNSGSLVKSGYLFNGWNTAANGSGTGYAVGATVTFVGATTLYASWTPSPLPSGLVSWWRGEGNGIDTAGGLTGTPSAGMAYTSGKVGQAFSLNGSTAYVTVPDNPKLSFGTNEFSIAAWIKTTDTLDWQRVVNKRAATGSANWYSLFIHQGSVWFEIAGSGLNFSSNAFVADGAWHQIAVTRDPAATTPRLYRLYVDGVEKNSWADGGLNLDNTGPLEIGKWSTNTPYSGLIDEVQMFNRSLAASEILAIYNAGSAGLALAPTVTAISPSAGPARTAVVISGSNLTGASVVKFGTNTAPSFTFDSDSQITAVAPDGIAATVADITVTTPGGVSAVSSVDRFTFIIADQVITFGPVPVVIGVGGNALVSATASSGLGVSFSSPTNSVCTISGTTVTGISTGTCTITANQPGSGAYNAAVQQTQDITIIAATAPTVATATATAISPTGTTATLNGTVNPNFSSADISFEYGTTTSYGSTATASQSPVSGGTATAVSAAISALNPGTRYHYRIKAVNAVTGTVYGDDATFTPLPRFVNLLDGTILDTSSSVRWLKNAYCYQQQIWETAMWTAAGLSSSYCGLTDGSIAGDWHLPTRDEFVSLVAVPDKHDYITLLASGFINTKNTAAWGVWLSTDINNDYAYKALTRPYSDDSYWLWPTPKSAISMVWPVRSGQYAILNSLVMTGKTDFGAQPLGTAATTQFTLKNISTASLTVTSVALGGANADQFTLSSGGALPCASLAPTLASGEVCTLLVTSQLTTVGSKSAALTVAIASESMTLPLAARSQSSVTYNGNGNSAGSVPSDSAEYADGSTVVVLGNSGSLVKSGYPFNGWNTAADGSGTGYAVGATFTMSASVTLYAMWPAKITPPSGLVSWWRGEGNAIDTLGTNNGTLHSDTTFAFANGKAGQAFSFSGETTEYVSATYDPTLNFGAGPFSMAVWVNTNDAAGVWKRIVTKGGTSGSSNWYSLVLNSGKVTFEIAGGSDVSSTVSVANGVWHHIAVTRDPVGVSPRKFHLYIDGVENVSMNDSGASLDNTGPLEIGKWGNEAYGGTIYSGLIDEVQLFNRALSSTEIQSIYSAGLAAPPVVTGISPSSGLSAGGTSVIITGTNLTGATAVMFGSRAASSFTFDSDSQITAVAPSGTVGTAVDVTVSTPGGSSVSSAQFTYIKASAGITLSNLTPTYNGTAKAAVVTTVPAGLVVSTTYNDSATAPTNAGSYTVVATISDSNYQGSASGTLTIGKIPPAIGWDVPAAITAGTALSATQLNATASVAGTFSYTPAAGTFLSAGTHGLSASFTPSDPVNYIGYSVMITITVTAPVVIADTTPPVVTAFTIPASATSLTVPITSFAASDATGVTGYLVSESSSQPAADAAWTGTKPSEYTFASQGTKTLYAFAKDAAGNVSVPVSATVTITLPDTTAPTVSSFTIPATSADLIVAITALEATDDSGVTAWLLGKTTSATAGDSNWTTTKPTQHSFTSQGDKTLYAFAKDAAGNVSAPLSASVTITLADSAAPTVDAFTTTASSTSLTVAISSLTANDNTAVTGYLVSESGSQPTADATGWSSSAPVNYTFTSQGDKTFYAFAKDAAGNVSVPATAHVFIALADSTAPVVTAFIIPTALTSLTCPINSFTASDDTAVTGYLVSETATASADSGNWTATPTSSYTFAVAGAKTLYAYAKDAAGNVSTSATATVVITLSDTTAPTVTGFIIPASSTSLTVVLTTLTASDDTAVTGYLVGESATAPDASANGWSSTPPASYTFSSGGNKTAYAYAKDAAGNVSAAATATVVITQADTTAPVISSFSVTAATNSLTATIGAFTASDDTAVTGYLVTESSAAQDATTTGWSSTAPASYTFVTAGSKTLYAFVKDGVGNISTAATASVTITQAAVTTYIVAGSAGTGSSITPSGSRNVAAGATASFTVAADIGYGILSVTGCNGTLSGSSYTTGAITGNCTVNVTAVSKTGSSDGSTATIADALKTLKAVIGSVSLTAEEKIRYDVAPLADNGKPQGNGAVDYADVIMILRRSIGFGSW